MFQMRSAKNAALCDRGLRDQHREMLKKFDWGGRLPWPELVSTDTDCLIAGRSAAEELQRTVVTKEGIAGFHPAHAVYAYAPKQARIDANARHMKYGSTRTYWNDFAFEGYLNYRTEAIYLAGLPDVPESRPHSHLNSRRFRR